MKKTLKFESNVIYIGTKTVLFYAISLWWFESNVIYIGTKTIVYNIVTVDEFESNVIYIGTKTRELSKEKRRCLRVM